MIYASGSEPIRVHGCSWSTTDLLKRLSQVFKMAIMRELHVILLQKYRLCQHGSLFSFNCHRTTFRSYEYYLWLCSSQIMDEVCSFSRFVLVLLLYGCFINGVTVRLVPAPVSIIAAGAECSSTILHIMGNIPQMHYSTYVVPIHQLPSFGRFWTELKPAGHPSMQWVEFALEDNFLFCRRSRSWLLEGLCAPFPMTFQISLANSILEVPLFCANPCSEAVPFFNWRFWIVRYMYGL